MPVKLLLTVGITTIGGVVAEKVLNEIGMTEAADIVDKTSKGILAGATVYSVIKVLLEVNKLLVL